MTDTTTSISIHGMLDQVRAETVAARIRAAVRNGKRHITLAFDNGTVIASHAFLAFLLRSSVILQQDHGTFVLTGDEDVLALLRSLNIEKALVANSQKGDH